jgi:sugar-specific transcriptional regulator TrmB
MNVTLILKRFKDMGLSSYETKSYLSLLEKDTLTVSEVSKIAGIPRTNAYEALAKLLSRGMCAAKPGQTKKYTATDPKLLKEKFLAEVQTACQTELETLKEKEGEVLQKRQATEDEISAVLEGLTPQYEKSRLETNPMDYIEIIKDPYQIHKKYIQLLGQTKEEILVFSKPPFTGPREKLEEQDDRVCDILRGGIRVRSVYEILTDEDDKRWLFEHIHRSVTAGEEARVTEELPMKMAIFDSRIVLFALADPVSKQISLTSQIVEHPALAKSLEILFETFWEQAEDYHILEG